MEALVPGGLESLNKSEQISYAYYYMTDTTNKTNRLRVGVILEVLSLYPFQ